MIAFTICVFCICSYAPGSDDEPKGTSENPYIVPKATSAINIDAVLDEDAWKDALIMDLNYEVRPGENIAPPVKTEVLITYDEARFYAAFRCYDPEPQQIRAHLTDRDKLWGDEWAALVLDTFNDERRTFDFFVNPLGVQGDQIESSAGEGGSWDAIWASAGRITEWGWIVEIAIPFTSMRFQRTDGPQIWGFDAVRSYPRSVRHHIAMFPRDRNNNCYFCQMLKIKGFEGATPGRNIEIAPTLTALRTDARSDFPIGDFEKQDEQADIGITTRWGITPNLTLQATVNPDFSQVEADALKLDVNEPFALEYDEKRPFFVEDQELFDSPVVYTRTMRDPVWGLKFSGKEGANVLGAYVVSDSVTNLIFPGSQRSSATSLDMDSLASVFRYRRDIWNNSTLGVIYTDREGEGYYNRIFFTDCDFRVTSKDALYFAAAGSKTLYPDEIAGKFGQPSGSFGGYGWTAYYDHSTRNYRMYLSYEDLGKDFRSDIGFVPQVGYSLIEIGGSYTWWGEPSAFFNKIQASSNWDKTSEKNGAILEEEIEASVSFQGPKESFMLLYYGVRDRVYNSARFDQSFQGFYFTIWPTGDLYTTIGVRLDDRIDYAHTRAAKGINISPEVLYRFGKHVRIWFNHNMQQLSVAGDRLFLANLTQAHFYYLFNRRTFIRAIIHYSDVRYNTDLYAFDIDRISRELFTQLLFSYKINPQTVLFIGYTDNHYGTNQYSITQADRTFFVKIGYAWVL